VVALFCVPPGLTLNKIANVRIEQLSRNHYCRGKAVSSKYYEYVSVTLVIQHAKRMRDIVSSSVARMAPPDFFRNIS
jgi:hypothetical protein